MKKLLLGLLVIGVAFAMGCDKKDDTATSATGTTAGMPAGATTGMPAGATAGMPAGATAGMPAGATAGMPAGATAGMPAGATAGMPGATGMTGMGATGMGATGMAAATPTAEEPKKEMTKTLEETYPQAKIVRDKNNEVRTFIDPDAAKTDKNKHLTELQCREIALDFIRAQYFYFDTMSFEYRPSAGKLSGGVYTYKWVQIIRETKKTGNTISISVNPNSGKVAKYNSTRKDWDN